VSALKLIEHTELLAEMLSQANRHTKENDEREQRYRIGSEATAEETEMDLTGLVRSHWLYSWLNNRVLPAAQFHAVANERDSKSAGWSARRPYRVALVIETLKSALRMVLLNRSTEHSRAMEAYHCAQNERTQIRRMLADWDRHGALQLGFVVRRGKRTKRAFLTPLREPGRHVDPTSIPEDRAASIDQRWSGGTSMQALHAPENGTALREDADHALIRASVEDLFTFVVDRRGLVMAERLWSATERYLYRLMQQKQSLRRTTDERPEDDSGISGDVFRQYLAAWIRIWRPVIYLLLVPRVAPWSSWLVSFMLDVASSRWLSQAAVQQHHARLPGAMICSDAIPPAPLLLYMLREPMFSKLFVGKLILAWSRRGRLSRFAASLILGLAQAATKYYFLTAAS
jgi:hypothetical protein